MLKSHLQAANSDNITLEALHLVGTNLLVLSSTASICSSTLIVDFGAFGHICNLCTLFLDICLASKINVVLPTHSQISVEFIGTIKISKDFVLHDVLFIH